MSFDLGSQNLLIAIVLAVTALVFALLGCLLLGGKGYHVRVSAIALVTLITFSLFLVRTPMALNYYGFLGTEP